MSASSTLDAGALAVGQIAVYTEMVSALVVEITAQLSNPSQVLVRFRVLTVMRGPVDERVHEGAEIEVFSQRGILAALGNWWLRAPEAFAASHAWARPYLAAYIADT